MSLIVSISGCVAPSIIEPSIVTCTLDKDKVVLDAAYKNFDVTAVFSSRKVKVKNTSITDSIFDIVSEHKVHIEPVSSELYSIYVDSSLNKIELIHTSKKCVDVLLDIIPEDRVMVY